jgi:hypothetical protein
MEINQRAEMEVLGGDMEVIKKSGSSNMMPPKDTKKALVRVWYDPDDDVE